MISRKSFLLGFLGMTTAMGLLSCKTKFNSFNTPTEKISFNSEFFVSDEKENKKKFKELLSSEKETLVCLWATWCEPCIAELIDLKKEKARLEKKYEIILVNVDGGNKDRVLPEVKAWMISQKISIPTYFDFDDNLIKILGINSIPHSFAVSADKKILWSNSGILDWKAL